MKQKLILVLTSVISLIVGMVLYYLVNKNRVGFTMNEPKRPIQEIKREIYNGSPEAYAELRTIYLDYPNEDFLPWALYRANKYHDTDAYSDVYRIIGIFYGSDFENYPLKEMDSTTRKVAIYYLRLAAKSGDSTAMKILRKERL